MLVSLARQAVSFDFEPGSIVSYKTLRVLHEIWLRWSDKISPGERHDGLGVWVPDTSHNRDKLSHAMATGSRIFGYETHWIEKRQA